MGRDPLLAKRNLLALPGGVVTFYMAAALVYVLAFRPSNGGCGSAQLVLLRGTCYHIIPALVAGLLVGIALLGVALALFRAQPEFAVDLLRPGTPTHLALAVASSVVVVLGLAAAALAYIQGTQNTVFTNAIGPTRFKTTFLLELGAACGLLVLVPLAWSVAAQGVRRRHFIAAAQQEAERPLLRRPGAPAAEPAQAPAEEFVDETQWPDGREGDVREAPQNR